MLVSLDMPPLGATEEFADWKTANFNWKESVGQPWADYNLVAQSMSYIKKLFLFIIG